MVPLRARTMPQETGSPRPVPSTAGLQEEGFEKCGLRSPGRMPGPLSAKLTSAMPVSSAVVMVGRPPGPEPARWPPLALSSRLTNTSAELVFHRPQADVPGAEGLPTPMFLRSR